MMLETIVGLVGIVVTIISIIVTVISIMRVIGQNVLMANPSY